MEVLTSLRSAPKPTTCRRIHFVFRSPLSNTRRPVVEFSFRPHHNATKQDANTELHPIACDTAKPYRRHQEWMRKIELELQQRPEGR